MPSVVTASVVGFLGSIAQYQNAFLTARLCQRLLRGLEQAGIRTLGKLMWIEVAS